MVAIIKSRKTQTSHQHARGKPSRITRAARSAPIGATHLKPPTIKPTSRKSANFKSTNRPVAAKPVAIKPGRLRRVFLVLMAVLDCPACEHVNVYEACSKDVGEIVLCEGCRKPLLIMGKLAYPGGHKVGVSIACEKPQRLAG